MTPEAQTEIRAFFAANLPTAVVTLTRRNVMRVDIGEEFVAEVEERRERGQMWSRTEGAVSGYSVEGPHFPLAGNKRYGYGTIRRKKLSEALEAAKPFIRTKSKYELAREATKSARLYSEYVPNGPTTRDAALVELWTIARGRTVPDEIRVEVEAIQRNVLTLAAISGIREMYADFDEQFKDQ